jgi:hypothetical protein
VSGNFLVEFARLTPQVVPDATNASSSDYTLTPTSLSFTNRRVGFEQFISININKDDIALEGTEVIKLELIQPATTNILGRHEITIIIQDTDSNQFYCLSVI